MAISAYTRTTYNNRAAPAAGPTNLNKNEAQLKAISDEFTGELIRPATTKASIVDADEVSGNNSADSFKWVKWTWATVKTWVLSIVDAYGVGSASPPGIATFLAVLKSGTYTYGASTAGAPTADQGNVIFIPGISYDSAFATDITHWHTYYGIRGHGNGSFVWNKMWSASSDGNGGQPPAPKPNDVTNAMGKWGYDNSNILAQGQTGGYYASIVFTTGSVFYAASGSMAQGTDLSLAWGVPIVKHMYWRVV